MKSIKSPETDVLFDAILSLSSREEASNFFHDLCTYKEIGDFAQRLQVAIMLQSGMKYLEISKQTGASSATVCRVAKALFDGQGGYEKVLSKLKENENED